MSRLNWKDGYDSGNQALNWKGSGGGLSWRPELDLSAWKPQTASGTTNSTEPVETRLPESSSSNPSVDGYNVQAAPGFGFGTALGNMAAVLGAATNPIGMLALGYNVVNNNQSLGIKSAVTTLMDQLGFSDKDSGHDSASMGALDGHFGSMDSNGFTDPDSDGTDSDGSSSGGSSSDGGDSDGSGSDGSDGSSGSGPGGSSGQGSSDGSDGSYKKGGIVKGKGTGTSDSIQINVSNGEFVMPAKITKRYLPILEYMRLTGKFPKQEMIDKYIR